MNFYSWLQKRKPGINPRGNFIRSIWQDEHFPWKGDYNQMVAYIRDCGGDFLALDYLRRLHSQWLREISKIH